MKKLMICAAACCMLTLAHAGDKGPDRVVAADKPAFVPLAIEPAGQAERFTPEALYFSAPAGQTQAVYWVVGSTTNTVGLFIPSATAHVYAITNIPALYAGDKLVIVPSGDTATTNTVWLYGRRWY